ncbi:MAG TPA: IPT/TIG domain-containing protein [Thermoanaerobaculia bacterium]|nr:IPT/TIG domain-containing protein [Thermoanaerobaculia bacterium]
MYRKSLVFACLVWSSTALAQLPPVIRGIAPASSPVTGGTLVTITGDRLRVECATGLCRGPAVSFGSVSATVVANDEHSITVIAPPHSVGSVDIFLMRAFDGHAAAVASQAFTYQPKTGKFSYERFLIPTLIQEPAGLPGAFGSLWQTVLTIFDPYGPQMRATQSPDADCAIPCISQATGMAYATPVFSVGPGGSAFLYLERAPQALFPDVSGAEQFFANLRVRDLSRQSQTAGTEIPLVRDRNAKVRVINLLNVPTDRRFRRKVRVFEFEGINGTAVLATLYSKAPGIGLPLGTKRLTLSGATINEDGYVTRPAAAEFDITPEEFPMLVGEDNIRVELTTTAFPTTATRIWGYVTIVNNETQHVTLVTPQ